MLTRRPTLFFLYAHCKQSTNATVVGRRACGKTSAPTTETMIGWPIVLLYLCIYTYVQRQAISMCAYLLIKKKKEDQRKGSARGFTVVHVIQALRCTSRNFLVPLGQNQQDSDFSAAALHAVCSLPVSIAVVKIGSCVTVLPRAAVFICPVGLAE